MIQDIPDGLDLGQDQAALGGCGIYGGDQENRFPRLHQVAGDGRRLPIGRFNTGQEFL